MKLIHETQFCAPSSVYRRYYSSDEVMIESCESYQKRSLRNKCIIIGANGPITLTVPLKKGKHSNQLITFVEIAYHDNWQSNMLHTIRSCYGTSPYFNFYYDGIAKIIKSDYKLLWDLNDDLFQYFLEKTRTEIKYKTTSEYVKIYGSEWVDIRNKKLKEYPTLKSNSLGYAQVFEDRFGFVENLSIMDLLFCLGPESSLYLSKN